MVPESGVSQSSLGSSSRQGSGWLARLLPMWAAFILCEEAQACAVCFGDPDSDLAKGALAGVVLLGCVIFCVLLGIAGTAFHWSRKARRLAQPQDNEFDREDA